MKLEEPWDLALVGMACRFPGAPDLEAYWRLLCSGEDALREAPADRWDASAFYDPDPAAVGKMVCRTGGFVDGIDLFDADFFAISPREAIQLDPRQRLVLETGWEALEDAGIPADRLAGSRTGVFVSVLAAEFANESFARQPRLLDAYSGAGGTDSVIANRLSYVFDLKGPSLTVDTACSGSLVALHLAAQSLRLGECELALVGGVNLVLEPSTNVFFTKAGILSSDGRCHPFDHRADGTVRSDGAGMLVLKPLAAARAAGDRIYAVVRGSAINHNGRGNGLMAPSSKQQVSLLRDAYRRAGVSPAEAQFVEAHGTGTSLGDPIEVEALLEVFAGGRAAGQVCAFASVKSVLGHTEAAAGVAGLIKVALAMHHRQLPGMANFEKINPLIALDGTPLRLQTELGKWPQPEQKLVAGVSSFGLGGANAHVVIEEAPAPPAAPAPPTVREAAGAEEVGPWLLALSARSPAALRELARRYRLWLREPSRGPVGDLCRAAMRRRSHHRYRFAATGDRAGLLARLEEFLVQPEAESSRTRQRPRLVFFFSGQGGHWRNMGLELAEKFPAFDLSLRRSEETCRRLAGFSLREALADGAALEKAAIVQPAIAALQIALVDLLASFGIAPDLVGGQSLGEVAAAYAAGALDADGALAVACHRARLMARKAGSGATAFVAMPAAEAGPWLATSGGRLVVAGRSTAFGCIVAGDPAGIEAALASLETRGVKARRIADGGIAFHSPAMDELLGELHDALAELRPAAGRIPFHSAVTGARAAGGELGAGYWCRNLREPFDLPRQIESLCQAGAGTFVEIGPHPVATRPLQENLSACGSSAPVLPSLLRDSSSSPLLALLAALYQQGHTLDGLYGEPESWVDLPLYPWQRSRYWLERSAPPYLAGGAATTEVGSHPLIGARRDVAGGGTGGDTVAIWERRLAADSLHYLDEHRFLGSPVLPGAAAIEMVAAAARELLPGRRLELRSFELHRLMHLEPDPGREVQLVAARRAGGLDFKLASRPIPAAGESSPAFTLHATGRALPAAGKTAPPLDIQAIAARCPRRLSSREHYERMTAAGLSYGPAFQVVERIDGGDRELIARLRLPAGLEAESAAYQIHPALLDGALQVLAALETGDGRRYLPAGVAAFNCHQPSAAEIYCFARLAGDGGRAGHLVADVWLADAEGRVIAELAGVDLQPVGRAAAEEAARWLYELRWQETSAAPASGEGPATWLLLADRGGVAAALAEALRAAGHLPLLVHAGDCCRPAGAELAGSARPGAAEDFERQLAAASASPAGSCRRVVHCWNLDAPGVEALESGADLERAWELGCGTALAIFRTLAARPGRQPRLFVLSRGAQAAAAGDPVAPTQAAVWGLARSVGQTEHPELWGGLIDLDPLAAAGAEESAVLLAALMEAGKEDLLALRGGRKLAARLARAAAAEAGAAPELRPDAAYLVTGGFAGLAGIAAEWLAARGARHLLLAGRSPLPPRESWRSIAEGDPVHARIAAVRRLEALGISVQVAALDVADEAEVRGMLARWEAEGRPPIRGLVHLAGVARDRLATSIEPADVAAAWRPKAQGAWLLHRLLGERLELCVYFSSVAAIFSRPGQSVYAAANSFLDALAAHRRNLGLPAQSIGWGPFAEVGMAARLGLVEGIAATGIEPLLPSQGAELLRRLEGDGAAHRVAWRVDWPVALERLSRAAAPPLLALLAAEAPGATAVRPAEPEREALEPAELLGGEADPAERRRILRGLLVARTAQVLRLDPALLAADRPLAELGIDSIVVVELKGWVDQRFKVTIPIDDWLRGLSLEDIAARIEQELFPDGGGIPVWNAMAALAASGSGEGQR